MMKYRNVTGMLFGGLLLVGGMFFSAVQAQSVSTKPEKKNVLLEEYTGTGCGNCPDGAAIAASLKEARGSRFYTIAIHAGSYAEPSGSGADYRTDFGEVLLEAAGDIGFPCGSINRYPYAPDNGYVDNALNMYRNEWVKVTKQASTEDAPVNLYAEATVDAESREMKVRVEFYYTQDTEEDFHLLNVALLQNHVIGFQNGGGASYSHEHMLRHLLTGQWGDTVRDVRKGEVFTREYTYTLPEAIRGIGLDIRNVELVAFMTRTKREVLNVTGCKPLIEGLEEGLAAEVQTVALPSSRYGYTYFPVSVRSKCNDTITRMTFAVGINGGEETTVNVKVNIPPYETETVEVPTEAYEILASNTVALRPTGLNGTAFDAAALKYTFTEPIASASRILYIEMKTDMWGDEVSYTIRDRDGYIVYDKGPFEAGVQTSLNDTVVLEEDGVYALEFSDMWHDGWMVSPKGSYKVKDGNGKLIAQSYSIEGRGDLIFLNMKDGGAGNEMTQEKTASLRVVNTEEGFGVLNQDGLTIERVDVYSVNGARLHSESFRTDGDVEVRCATASTRIYIVGVATSAGTKYFKCLRMAR